MNIDEKAIAAFVSAKLADLKAKAPGYVSLSIEAHHHKSDTDSKVRYRGYNEHVGHSDYHETMDAAIAQIASRVSGKTEVEMLKEKAHELLEKARRLEEAEA